MSVQKGVAKLIGFDLVTTAGAEDTTSTPTVQISKDGGAYAATTNAAARLGSTGSFSLALTSAEMTADLVKIRAVASGDVPVFLNLYTESDYTTTRAGYIVSPPTNWGATSIDSSGRMLLQPTQTGVTIPAVTAVTNAVLLSTGTGTGQITLTAGEVTVGTNSDKTGYSLGTSQTFNTTGSVGSVTGAVGSVTGNVAGNVVGSVGSLTGYTAPLNSTQTAQAVLNATASTYNTAGSIGAQISAAGGSGDPWATDIPGSYSAGTAGYILGTNIDAKVSSRSTYAGGDTSGTGTLLGRIGQVLLFDGSGNIKANAEAVGDKTGYALTTAEHTAISGTDVPAAMTAQGYTTARAGFLDTLNGIVAAIWSAAGRTLSAFGFSVAVSDKTGFSLATAPPTSDQIAAKILVNPAHLLTTDSSGNVAANNLPVEFLTSAEQGELTDAVNDLVALLGRTDTAATVSTIATAVTTLLSRLPASISFTGGNVNANAAEWGGSAVAGMPLAASAYTAPDNSDIATALADVASLIGRADPTTALNAIKAITDQITFTNGLANANATVSFTTEQTEALALINVALAGLTTAPGTPEGLALTSSVQTIEVISTTPSSVTIQSGSA